MKDSYDVVVVGGGAAGLAGALALVRSRRSVLVLDGGEPRNAPAGHVHNYLGREGTPPGELLATGRAEVTGYGGEIVTGTVSALYADGALFRVVPTEGAVVTARRLLVATGAVDELPDVPGLAARFGRDVLHCPYCHGWEVRDQPIGILATSPLAAHQAQLFRQLSPDVVLFEHTADLDPADRERFAALGIPVIPGKVAGLEVTGANLSGVRLETGEVVPRTALVVQSHISARAGLLATLGLTPVPVLVAGHEVGTRIESAPGGATTVPGVYVAGNITDIQAQVIGSAAAGLAAGAAINADLINTDLINTDLINADLVAPRATR
jgi:thioredoxin reductase